MSATKAIPDGYHSLQPYVMFQGCAAAIDFYVKAFDAREKMRMTNEEGLIKHAEIEIGDSVMMMADEAPAMEAFGPGHFGGSPVSMMLYMEDCDAVYRRALEAGGESIRAPSDQDYGDRMAGVRDPFGYKWWIATHIK